MPGILDLLAIVFQEEPSYSAGAEYFAWRGIYTRLPLASRGKTAELGAKRQSDLTVR